MKTPKYVVLFMSAIGGSILLPSTASAAASPPPEDRRGEAQKRLQAHIDDLGLTPEQREKLGPILRSEREKIASLRADESLSPRDRLRKLQAVREEITPRVKAILTPEQFARWEKSRGEERERMRERLRDRRR
ncbi:MAG: hypothetical protein RIR76_3250 [Verrucomicrobiota bacterium]|jgi:Spy/CpxP family protein refolding chaperone